MIKCSSCDKSEATVFYVFDQWANVWRDDPEEYVCCKCDSCFAHLSALSRGVSRSILHPRVPILRDDYLAALAMAEL